MKRCIPVALLSLAVFTASAAAHSDPVAYTNAPLSNVIAQLSEKYGIHIVLEGDLTNQSGRLVTFSAGSSGTTPTRLEVINSLANAARVAYQKGFVISKISDGQAPPHIPVDTKAYIFFKSTDLPARDAITAISNTDGATVHIASDITGDVKLTATKLTLPEAAKEVADQTHTRWVAYYALMPTTMQQKGTVVGHTANGQPIIELPFTTYIHPAPPTPDTPATTTPATGTAPGAAGATPPATGETQAPNSGVNVYPGYNYSMPYGQMPYTYGDAYGYGPNGSGPYQYQYGNFGYGNTGGVGIMPGEGGYGPFGGYGNPVTF